MTSPTEPQPDKVKGPASYFPVIERKYGKAIAEWQALIRSNPSKAHGARDLAQDPARHGPRQRPRRTHSAGRRQVALGAHAR